MSDFIQFKPVQLSEAPPEDTADISAACIRLTECNLLSSYEGTSIIGSNGNVSKRQGAGFIITSTQLPAKQNLGPQDFVHIEKYTEGETHFHGSKLPSSECLMHLHLFESFPDIQAIVHVHESNDLLYGENSRACWTDLGIVETAEDVKGGTIAVGEATAEAFTEESLYVILKNHRPDWDPGRTGAVVMGRTLEEATERAIAVHNGLKQ